ncbi:hypothetical protein Tco_0133059 [Tanacetum coccineum]
MKREQFTVEYRAKFLHDTIAAQRRFLAEQRAVAIRNRPPTRTQLRNQMMTYLKHVGNKKHSDLSTKPVRNTKFFIDKGEKVQRRERCNKDDCSIRKRSQQSDVDSEDEHRKCLKIVALDSTIDIEVMETKSVIARLDKVSITDGILSCYIAGANGNFNYITTV